MSATRAGASRPALWRELALGLTLFGVYIVVELLGGATRRQVADQHALAIARLEHRLGIDVEAAMNHWLVPHTALTRLANYEYAFSYILAAALLLTWVYLRRPLAYPLVRNSFVALNLVGLACFLLYPLTPPRMLPQLDMVDTVQRAHTWGSWGSPLVEQANHLAAMPSLHVGWALWASVMLALLHGTRVIQLASAAHVLLTTLVIMATANHFLLDAVGGAVAVWLGVAMARTWGRLRSRIRGDEVAPADATIWHADPFGIPLQIGALGLFGRDHAPDVEDVRRRVQESLADLTAFLRRLEPGSRWHRPRWVRVAAVDMEWHVSEHDLTTASGGPGDLSDLNDFVAELLTTRLPADRPPWRIVMVHGVSDHRSAIVLLAHHAIASDLDLVGQVLTFLDPGTTSSRDPAASDRTPEATAGQVAHPARRFAFTTTDTDRLRRVAHRHGCRVTDVLLSAVAGAVSRRPDLQAAIGPRLRVVVPPSGAATGDITAGGPLDLPLGPMPEAERLALVAERGRRLTRTPAPASRWFARTAHGRGFVHAIVCNGAGPTERLAGATLTEVIPLLSVAPGMSLAVGGFGWNGAFGIGVSSDPGVCADQLCADLVAVIEDLHEAAAHVVPGPPRGISLDRLCP